MWSKRDRFVNSLILAVSTVIALGSPCPDAPAAEPPLFVDSGETLGAEFSFAPALGDLDGDGDLDVFVANMGPNSVWLNSGTGAFSHNGESLGVAASTSVTLGDLDGDGDLDAFVTNAEMIGGAPNTVYLNFGNGWFADTFQNLGMGHSADVALGDLDGDGDLDAFVGNGDTNVAEPNSVWINDGTGFFTDSGQRLGNSASIGVALGDLDGDGDLDAFVADVQNSIVWMNDGAGGFTSLGEGLDAPGSYDVALGDLDGDGDLDAFVAGFMAMPNTVWINGSTGAFTDSGQRLGTEWSRMVGLGDLDSDGDLDAFVADYGSALVGSPEPNRVWLNDGQGTFTDSGTGYGNLHSCGVALGDLDRDGDLDAFITNVGDPTSGADPNKVWLNTTFPRIPDWNQDGKVDAKDLSILCEGFHREGGGRACDLTGDRDTDLEEFFLFATWWGWIR